MRQSEMQTANLAGKKGIVTTDGKVANYFNELELSPLHTSKEFAYIPSFACLLGKEENEEIKKFVERKNNNFVLC